MNEVFLKSFARVFKHEGGFTADPDDRGNWTSGKIGVGKLNGTKFGLAAMTYPNLDIRNLTLAQARDIYYQDWWIKLGMERFCEPMRFQMFDAAINHGMRTATKLIQRTVGVKEDGIIGPNTLRAAGKADMNDKLLRFNGYRLKFYTSCRTWDKYGKGWCNRLASNLIIASEDN